MADYNNTMTEEELRNKTINAGLEDNLQDDYVETPVVATPTYTEPPKQTHWYENVFKEENGDLNLSEEDRKKLRRRERAERTIAGLGDLGAHIANVWGAAKGSTPAAINKTMSDAYNTKWEKLGLDYDQRKRAYNSGLAAAQRLDYQQYLADRRQYLAEQKEERMRWQSQAKYDADKAREAKTNAEIAAIQGKSPAEIRKLEEQANYWAARAEESRARAEGRIPIKSSSGGSRGSSKTSNTSKPTSSGVKEPTKDDLIKEFQSLGGNIPKDRNGLPKNVTADQLRGGIRALRESQGLPPAEWDKPNESVQSSSGNTQTNKNNNGGSLLHD